MLEVFTTLAPVFLVIALGAVLRWFELINDGTVKGMNWLTYWVGLPALLIMKIAGASLEFFDARQVLVLHGVGIGACILAGLLLALITGMPRQRVGTFLQAGFRGNLAFVALPVIVFAFTDVAGKAEAARAEGLVALSLGPVIVVYNILAVIALQFSAHHSFGPAMLGKLAIRTVTNPMVLSCTIGIVLAIYDVQIPLFAARTLDVLGQFALPLALICVGGSLAATPMHGHAFDAVLGSLVKLAVAPLAGYFIGRWLGFDSESLKVAVMMLAAPTAVASYVMADQMDGDAGLASSCVVLSSILSPISFAVVLWYVVAG